MSDAEPSSVPPVPVSEHSRVLIAMHKAMRADSQRLIAAVDALPAGDHLDREEAVVVPPFASLLSEADQHTLSKEEAKLSTYRHMRMAVPWVLANATPEVDPGLRRHELLPPCRQGSAGAEWGGAGGKVRKNTNCDHRRTWHA